MAGARLLAAKIECTNIKYITKLTLEAMSKRNAVLRRRAAKGLLLRSQ